MIHRGVKTLMVVVTQFQMAGPARAQSRITIGGLVSCFKDRETIEVIKVGAYTTGFP
jgi:hypothetical protein